MQRKGLQIGLIVAVLGAGSAGAGELVPMQPLQAQPLKLDLQLAADDWLLESGLATEQLGTRPTRRSNRLALAANRAGSGFRIGPILPALCENDLPGTSAVVDAYNRAMECDDDQIGLSVSIRNY